MKSIWLKTNQNLKILKFEMIDENISPESLKRYSIQELELLAENIRKRIIDTLSKTGGHLSSNLGVVELTLAMHYSFNSPIDKFIFDVSHQMYPHKLLTGRDKLFDSLRQFNGLCGFSHPDESEHDHFYSGHAGTALPLSSEGYPGRRRMPPTSSGAPSRASRRTRPGGPGSRRTALSARSCPSGGRAGDTRPAP